MMASAPGCHGQSTDLQTRAREPAEGMPVDFPARQRAVRSTDLESCSSGLKSRGPKSPYWSRNDPIYQVIFSTVLVPYKMHAES